MAKSGRKKFNDLSKKGKLWRISQLPLAVILANYLAYPTFESVKLTNESVNVRKSYPYSQFEGLPEQDKKTLIGRNYLDMATLIVQKKNPETQDCKYYPRMVMGMYHRLINNADRNDLSTKVRVVAGQPEIKNDNSHLWLQIKESGKWINYEPTRFIPRKEINVAFKMDGKGYITEPESIRNYSERTKKLRGDLINEFPEEIHFVSKGIVFLPTANAFTYWKGLAGIVFDLYKNNKLNVDE